MLQNLIVCETFHICFLNRLLLLDGFTWGYDAAGVHGGVSVG